MEKLFKYNFKVSGYELDSFGHVNNAVYLNYLEQARWEIINELGLLDYIRLNANYLVVIEANIRYIHELGLFEEAVVETKMKRVGYFIEFSQNISMKNSSKRIAKAIVKCLFVDEDRIPQDIPDVIYKYLDE